MEYKCPKCGSDSIEGSTMVFWNANTPNNETRDAAGPEYQCQECGHQSLDLFGFTPDTGPDMPPEEQAKVDAAIEYMLDHKAEDDELAADLGLV